MTCWYYLINYDKVLRVGRLKNIEWSNGYRVAQKTLYFKPDITISNC